MSIEQRSSPRDEQLFRIRRKRVVKHLTVMDPMNEPFVRYVQPRRMWWVWLSVLRNSLEVDWSVVFGWGQALVEWLQTLPSFFRRPAREA